MFTDKKFFLSIIHNNIAFNAVSDINETRVFLSAHNTLIVHRNQLHVEDWSLSHNSYYAK